MNRRGFFGKAVAAIGAIAAAPLAAKAMKAAEPSVPTFSVPTVWAQNGSACETSVTWTFSSTNNVPTVRYLTKADMARMDCPFGKEDPWER